MRWRRYDPAELAAVERWLGGSPRSNSHSGRIDVRWCSPSVAPAAQEGAGDGAGAELPGVRLRPDADHLGGSPYVTDDVAVEHHEAWTCSTASRRPWSRAVLNGEAPRVGVPGVARQFGGAALGDSRSHRLAAGSRSGEPQARGAGGDWDRAGPSAGDGFLPPGPAPPLPPSSDPGADSLGETSGLKRGEGSPSDSVASGPLWRSLGWNARSTSSRQVRRSSPSERSAKRARGPAPTGRIRPRPRPRLVERPPRRAATMRPTS